MGVRKAGDANIYRNRKPGLSCQARNPSPTQVADTIDPYSKLQFFFHFHQVNTTNYDLRLLSGSVHCVKSKPKSLPPLLKFSTTFGITNAPQYAMVEIICVFTVSFDLHDARGRVVERDEEEVECGKYFIVTEGMCHS